MPRGSDSRVKTLSYFSVKDVTAQAQPSPPPAAQPQRAPIIHVRGYKPFSLDSYSTRVSELPQRAILPSGSPVDFKIIGRVACSSGGASRLYLVDVLGYQQGLLKTPDLFPGREEECIARFRDEIEAMKKRLPHVPALIAYDNAHVGGTQGFLPPRFYIMEMLDGQDLCQYLINRENEGAPPLEMAAIIRILRTVLETLKNFSTTFGDDAIHRDLKPENIFIAMDSEEIYLIDFGVARIPKADKPDERLTRSGLYGFIGTPLYAPPEAFFQGSKNLTPSADIFSLGLIAYRMATRRLPYDVDLQSMTGIQTLRNNFRAILESIHNDRPSHFPAPLWPVFVKATQFDPTQRYQTFQEFDQALLECERDYIVATDIERLE